MTRTSQDRPRVTLKRASPFYRMTAHEIAIIGECSEGHARRIVGGGQLGEPFIAAALFNYGIDRFYELFEIVGPFGTQGSAEVPAEVKRTEHPTSWSEALDAGHTPTPGPPIHVDDPDILQDDRIVLYTDETPVLAFQEDGNLRTYPATLESPIAREILDVLGVELGSWIGTTIPNPRKRI